MQLLAKSGFAFALMRGKVSCHARHIKSSVRRNLMPTQFDLPRQFHLVLSRCLNHLMYNYLGVELLVSGDFRQWGDTPYSHVEWWRQYCLNPSDVRSCVALLRMPITIAGNAFAASCRYG